MKIEIKTETLERLKKFDGIIGDDAINKFLDTLDKPSQMTSNKSQKAGDLSFTRVVSAKINEEVVDPPNWDSILRCMLILAAESVQNKNQLAEIFDGLNVVMKIKTDRGYKPIDSIGVSYQASSSNAARNVIIRAANKLGFAVDIKFRWRDHKKAARPGENGYIQVNLNEQIKQL